MIEGTAPAVANPIRIASASGWKVFSHEQSASSCATGSEVLVLTAMLFLSGFHRVPLLSFLESIQITLEPDKQGAQVESSAAKGEEGASLRAEDHVEPRV
jgi:hypothetical protein